jgi:endonuclease YncB( thermonuclease family)
MNKYVISALLMVTSSCYAADMTLPIKGTIDGDTIATQLALPCPLCKASVRIRGIDTPEKGSRAKCTKEADLAALASGLTKQLIGTATEMTVTDIKWDKYGGRIDGFVFINGHSVGDELIKAGVAVRYDGKKKKSWCS